MRLNRVKKILATMVCVALLAGDVLPTAASVSDGDAMSSTELTEDSFLNNAMKTVSDSDVVDTYATISGGDIALFAAAGTASDGDAQASYTVTVQHKLADEPDKKFYRDVEMTVRNDQKLQVGVLSGDDYYISQVQIYTENEENEELISTVNATDIDGIKTVTDKGTYLNLDNLELTADTRVLVLYKPNGKTVTGDVTFFDYEVADTATELTEFIFHSKDQGMDDALYFTYNGKQYNDYKITQNISDGYGINRVYDNNNINNEITFKDGDVLTNVRVNCWHNGTDKEKAHADLCYSKVIVHQKGTRYYYEAYTAPNAKDAGINANAFDEKGSRKSNYLGMGINGFHDNTLMMANKYDNGNQLDANTNNTNNPDEGWRAEFGNKAIISGLVDHLEGDNYENVVWGKAADGGQIQEPGYFAAGDVAVKGRTVYSDRFNLQFSQTGHKYVLEGSVDKGNENKFTSAGKGNAGFFPLNDVPHPDTAEVVMAANGGQWDERYHALTVEHNGVKENNPYFGMRYDFNFTLGDYEGELQYTFEGDDDMWVFLDGKLILDLGGIHSAYPSAYEQYKPKDDSWAPSTVDLWKCLGENPDRSTTHRITVLYMERGGYDSNCYMEFVLPNATPVQSVITERPTTSLELTKVDDAGQVLAGAEFTLTNKATNAVVSTKTSDENGKVTFNKLTKGEYVLRETKAPEGYEMDSKEYHITVTEQDGTASITASDLPTNNQIVNKKLLGSLQITKKIDRMNEVYGTPSFTFKIEGPDGLVLYRTITFDSTDDLAKAKTVTIRNVPVGNYKVTEESTLRYECEEAYVKVNGQKTGDGTTAQVTGTQIPEFYFKNKLTSETYYSHTDVVVNKIHRNEDGSFTISKEKQSSEETTLQKSN